MILLRAVVELTRQTAHEVADRMDSRIMRSHGFVNLNDMPPPFLCNGQHWGKRNPGWPCRDWTDAANRITARKDSRVPK